MKEFYYQIKGKKSPNQDLFDAFGSNWVFPPIFSGKVQALTKKLAKEQIDIEYSKKFPQRVLSKDLDSNEFLLKIEEITPGSHIERLFNICSCKNCGKEFKVIDKYNDYNVSNKGFDYCSDECRLEANELTRMTINQENELQGSAVPVIYMISNLVTGMVYVGKTTQAFTLRWYQHFFQSSAISKFHKAIHESKVTDWTFKIIEVVKIPIEITTLDDANDFILQRERFWINAHDSIDNGYNSRI